jgi:hypothetical protein
MKPSFTARFFRRSLQLSNRFEDYVDFFVVFSDSRFEASEFPGEFRIGFERLPECRETYA